MNRSLAKYYASANDALSRLSPRDQRAAYALLVALSFIVLWQGIWHPVYGALESNRSHYVAVREDLKWMQDHQENAKNLQDSAATASNANVSLLTLVTTSTQPYEITVKNAEPDGDKALHLTIDKVAFDKLLPWLEHLQNESHITTSQIDISRLTEAPGYVKVTLTLKLMY